MATPEHRGDPDLDALQDYETEHSILRASNEEIEMAISERTRAKRDLADDPSIDHARIDAELALLREIHDEEDLAERDHLLRYFRTTFGDTSAIPPDLAIFHDAPPRVQ